MNLNWVELGISEECADQLDCELFYLDPLIKQIRADKFSNRGRNLRAS